MMITVRFFAILRELGGKSEVELRLGDEATVRDALDAVAELSPAIARHLSRAAAAVNQEYVPAETKLRDGDELALIPPVSGG